MSTPEEPSAGSPESERSPEDETPSEDAPKLGLFAQLKSFERIYWTANGMEMIERFSYYGLRSVLPMYLVLAVESGGPEFDNITKGFIFFWWAAVQSGVPVFTGGYADKYGYKLTVAISVAIKILGYLVMGFAIPVAALFTGGASVGVKGHPVVFWVFLTGALLLALGTAVFKPGLQGIIAVKLKKSNASVGWAVFYQVVNVGGWLGPYLASAMNLISWTWVFVACAVIIAFNWLVLLTFPEPEKQALSKKDKAADRKGLLGALRVFWDSGIGICEPRLMSFLVVFSGFWAMFHQLFDLLPQYIDEWVDSSMVADAVVRPLFGLFGTDLPTKWGGMVPAEQMININAAMCALLAFVIGYFTGKVRSMTAMICGIIVSAGAIYGLGTSTNGWWILGCIAMFSIGELMSSPTKMRYFSSIAPPGKKAMYLGYINATGGIGWALGAIIAGAIYEEGGDKFVLARRHLVETLGHDATAIDALPKTEVMPFLAEKTQQTVVQAQEMLYTTYTPTEVWTHFAIIGLVSMCGLIIFDIVTRLKLRAEAIILAVLTCGIATFTYGWIWGVIFTGLMIGYLLVQYFAPHFLPQGRSEE